MPHSPDHLTEQLDRDRLLQLYEDDTDMLITSIETFLEEVLPTFQELERLIESQDWTAVTGRTHQLRPWLGMVGLTRLESKLCEIEELAKKDPNHTTVMNSYHNFNTDLARMVPVLKSELHELTK
ncbi:hypothetical protein GCM10028803_15960 [Larkinella knui]|uniref:Hpt domain-containing protein n=1 Tax=Larkinella knui TaxID=2025310 RepID=A0A3P1CUU2_9BACT|nr:Hpt domain-containing protein [Larkinella knui]RRB16724.1 Hpt domain-containing protein [Larkinella knui]